MRLPRLRMAVAAASAAVLMSAGCGSGTDVRDLEPPQAPDLSLVRSAFGAGDLQPASYPAEIVKLRGAKEIVTGSVERIEVGRKVSVTGTKAHPLGPRLHMIVLRVRVSDVVLNNLPGAIHDGRIYVELYQGATVNGSRPFHPISVWRRAIPVGTKTILFLYDSTWGPRARKIIDNGRGRPSGAKLLEADPEGMLFAHDDQLLSVDDGENGDGLNPWGMHSIDEVVQNVKKRLRR